MSRDSPGEGAGSRAPGLRPRGRGAPASAPQRPGPAESLVSPTASALDGAARRCGRWCSPGSLQAARPLPLVSHCAQPSRCPSLPLSPVPVSFSPHLCLCLSHLCLCLPISVSPSLSPSPSHCLSLCLPISVSLSLSPSPSLSLSLPPFLPRTTSPGGPWGSGAGDIGHWAKRPGRQWRLQERLWWRLLLDAGAGPWLRGLQPASHGPRGQGAGPPQALCASSHSWASHVRLLQPHTGHLGHLPLLGPHGAGVRTGVLAGAPRR